MFLLGSVRTNPFTECETSMTIYVSRNIEARSCKHHCSGKTTSITYCERVCL